MRTSVAVIVCFLSSLFLASCSQEAQDKKAIQECFDNYRKASSENNGLEAAKYIDKKTVEHYEQILKEAKTSDSAAIIELNLIDRLSVLATRHLFKKEEILTMNGESLFILLIASEMISDNEKYQKVLVQNIHIEGSTAKGEVLIDNGEKITIEFNKVNNHWKFNLTSMFRTGEKEFRKMVSELDKSISENEFLLIILEETNKQKPTKEIWHPIM